MKHLVLLSRITKWVYQEVWSVENPKQSLNYTALKQFLLNHFQDTSKFNKLYREIYTIQQTGDIQEFNKIFSKNILLIQLQSAEKFLLNTYTTVIKKDYAL
jgi:hypothetical protein